LGSAGQERDSGIRLVAFDLDGTLTRGRSCLEAVAGALGFAAQMALFERASSEEEIIAARHEIREHLKQADPSDVHAALSTISLAPGAVQGISALQECGISTIIVSLTFTVAVAYFAERLHVDAHIATDPDSPGGIRHVFASTKPALLAQHAKSLGIGAAHIAAVGDTPADLPMLRSARTSFYLGTVLPPGFAPTWHLPSAPIDQIARLIIEGGTRIRQQSQ
jgi:HAD superfamily phosphoserine phosphatase-like hydrolase